MQVSVEELSDIQRELVISVESTLVEDAFEQKVQKIAKNARIDGFRPGKVPLREVKRRYGDSVRLEVVSEIVEQAYKDACLQNSLNPLGSPEIELPNSLDRFENDRFEFKATIEVYPKVELQPFDTIKVTSPTVSVSEDDIATVITRMRDQRAEYVKVDRVAEEGDRVTIDFEGKRDGEIFEGGVATDFQLELGSRSMIPGFEEGVIGMGIGEEKTIDVVFPSDYHESSLANQPAEFKIIAKLVESKQLPDIDEEFLKVVGMEGQSVETFENDVRENIEREVRVGKDGYVKAQVASELVDAHQFSVPQFLLAQEIDELRHRFFSQIGMHEPTSEQLGSLPRNMFEDRAIDRVKAGIIFHTMIQEQNLEVPEPKLRETVEELAQPYDNPQEVIDWYYANPKNLDQVKSLALESMLVDQVLEACQVEKVDWDYEAAVRQFREYEQERNQELSRRRADASNEKDVVATD